MFMQIFPQTSILLSQWLQLCARDPFGDQLHGEGILALRLDGSIGRGGPEPAPVAGLRRDAARGPEFFSGQKHEKKQGFWWCLLESIMNFHEFSWIFMVFRWWLDVLWMMMWFLDWFEMALRWCWDVFFRGLLIRAWGQTSWIRGKMPKKLASQKKGTNKKSEGAWRSTAGWV